MEKYNNITECPASHYFAIVPSHPKSESLGCAPIHTIFGMEQVKANHKVFFEKFEIYAIGQVGYPDYVVYEQSNAGVLYSGNFYFFRKSDKKEIKVPFHYAHDVNAESKITSETAYYYGNLHK